MSFRETLPWTYMLWRFLCSKPVRVCLVTFASFLIAMILAFHIESLLFQQKVNLILSRMARIRLGSTSEQELRALLPELDATSRVICSAELGASTEYGLLISDVDRGVLFKLVESLDEHNRPARQVLYLLGHRFHRFGVYSSTCGGKVVRLKYFVWIDGNQNHGMFEGTEVSASGFSRNGWVNPIDTDYRYERVTPYVEWRASNAPENVLRITYTADAPSDFLHAAHDLRLACLHSFTGCANTRQLLPNVWPPRFPWRRYKF